MVPIILAVGNHDVGFDPLHNINITVSNKGPLYFNFFPMKYSDEINRIGIPEVSNRETYNYHIVGNSLFFSLDSGYLHGYAGKQKEFIEDIISKYPNHKKFAQYHVIKFHKK